MNRKGFTHLKMQNEMTHFLHSADNHALGCDQAFRLEEAVMKNLLKRVKSSFNRRSFLKNGLTAAGAATMSAGLLAHSSFVLSQEGPEERSGNLTPGDAAMLRFAAAAEILETDCWVQYNELGGIQDSEVPGGSGIPAYTAALQMLDSDMPQYIHDNTDDEFTHQNFLNAYLASKGADKE